MFHGDKVLSEVLDICSNTLSRLELYTPRAKLYTVLKALCRVRGVCNKVMYWQWDYRCKIISNHITDTLKTKIDDDLLDYLDIYVHV